MIGHWFMHYTGSDNPSGPWYGFWSGFGSDLTEFAILGGLIQFVRHQNCHVKGCWFWGKPIEGTAFRACWKHHPDHPGDSRNISEGQLREVAEK